MANKKKPALSAEAARVLEQYRKAGKKGPAGGADIAGDSSTAATQRTAAAQMAPVHRSGTRGK